MKKIYYFDNNATTQVDKRVFQTMLPYFTEKYSNPSSIYRGAQIMRGDIDSARKQVAELLNADSSEIVFTSGGTESNNTVIKGVAYTLKEKGNHIITSQIEHHAVLNPCEYLQINGYDVTFLPVDKYGMVDPDDLKKAVRKDTILITIMYANNEIGIIEPITEIGEIAREHEVYFHTDAVQAVGKIPVDVRKLGVNFLSLSGHKIYGPKGTGVLYIKNGSKCLPLLQGGHHEKHRRAGTENVPGIIGLGKACEIVKKESSSYCKKIKSLREKLKSMLLSLIPDIKINEHPERTLCNTLNISIKGIESQDALMMFDQKGFCLSSGSACSSGLPEPSHVLKALNFPDDLINGTLRISLGKFNTEKEISLFSNTLSQIVKKSRDG